MAKNAVYPGMPGHPSTFAATLHFCGCGVFVLLDTVLPTTYLFVRSLRPPNVLITRRCDFPHAASNEELCLG